MIKTRIISYLAFLQFVCIPAYSQKEGVVVVYSKASSGYDIQVTNKGSVPVTAFIVSFQIRRPAGNNSNLYFSEDVYCNYGDTPMRTNEIRQYTHVGPRGQSEGVTAVVSLLAAVYQDGTSEGDPLWVSRIASNRERIRQDLPVATEMMKQALSEGVDSSVLASRFEDFRLRNVAGVQSTGKDRVFEQAAAEHIPTYITGNLKDIPAGEEGKEALKGRIGALINTFTEWYAKIPH